MRQALWLSPACLTHVITETGAVSKKRLQRKTQWPAIRAVPSFPCGLHGGGGFVYTGTGSSLSLWSTWCGSSKQLGFSKPFQSLGPEVQNVFIAYCISVSLRSGTTTTVDPPLINWAEKKISASSMERGALVRIFEGHRGCYSPDHPILKFHQQGCPWALKPAPRTSLVEVPFVSFSSASMPAWLLIVSRWCFFTRKPIAMHPCIWESPALPKHLAAPNP